ncbi:5-dehydro-4-deoxyglucarate dehydratase [Saccharopolyspora phatthalungensis]|uniref:Probable 5-dehydro-4-deoxyglucarate dehydratase n=1 Tax=Saccharopolyspora phatthalungensis TaxID=664693 RepID=A0A840QGS9_9PSEU|nr:5-dehydro-4-deoxyglucarate dehydratase [Saccharopolyspora phatthalungensis]MBB5156393.1 5-dehydro-4-deoxyglucarate dehydratase [Saccharopolyspora phatthalungensis]
MTRFSPEELKNALGTGLLCFPVTHATAQFEFDLSPYRAHLQRLAEYDAAGVFAAGGTGEFFSLGLNDVAAATRAAVAEATDGVPVVAPAGYGTATAIAMAKDAETAGADGLFLLPPYLTEVDQEGLFRHVKAVCDATSLGVIVYHRANARFTPATFARLLKACPNIVGFKDGIGDIDLLATLCARHADRLVLIGGLPTAETYALPYLELGVTTYSSAIFNFAPRWASEFYQAVRNRDRDEIYRRVDQFVLPYLEIRNRRAGYAVSIVKAGLRAIGQDAGPVRPPLTDLTEAEHADLDVLVKEIS